MLQLRQPKAINAWRLTKEILFVLVVHTKAVDLRSREP